MDIRLDFPAMKIHRIKRKLRRADEEPVAVTITHGDMVAVLEADIPETFVDQVNLTGTHWRVRACSARDADQLFLLELPAEDVLLQYLVDEGSFAAVAQPITMTASYKDENGAIWTGAIDLGACEADFLDLNTNLAEPISATGILARAS